MIIENLSGITAGSPMVGTPIILVQRPINPGLIIDLWIMPLRPKTPEMVKEQERKRCSRWESNPGRLAYRASGPGFDSRRLMLCTWNKDAGECVHAGLLPVTVFPSLAAMSAVLDINRLTPVPLSPPPPHFLVCPCGHPDTR